MDDLPGLDDRPDALKAAQVGQRIAVDEQQIGRLPVSTVPISASRPSVRAAMLVAPRMAVIAGAPCSWISRTSRATMSEVTPRTPQSVPVAIGMPMRIAVSHDRRWSGSMRSDELVRPGSGPRSCARHP